MNIRIKHSQTEIELRTNLVATCPIQMKVLKAVQHNTMDELNPFRRITFKDLAAVELFHNVASLSNEKTRRFALPLIPEKNQIDKFFERRQFRSKMLFFIFEMI